MLPTWRRVAVCCVPVAVASCATIPDGRYGVSTVEVEGTKRMDEYALRACLATHERPAFEFALGRTADPECGEPPFDADRVMVRLWRWPWTDWPVYDRTVFERDVDRVERWYRARGFYDTHVLSQQVRLDPDDHEAHASIRLREGEPVYVAEIRIVATDPIIEHHRAEINEALQLHVGERFDETLYDRSKEEIARILRDEGHARATVEGRVAIDPVRRRASVNYHIVPGPHCYFGRLTIEGQGDLPGDTILAAALIDRGDLYSQAALEEAQRAIYSLGAFSSVSLEPDMSGTDNIIDVKVRVVPGRLERLGIGAGMQIGQRVGSGDVSESVNEWDVHLLVPRYENRNFFGGLRRFRFEVRPRLIFSAPFPSTPTPVFGIQIPIEFRQPAFIEPRTTLVAGARFDRGPNPYQLPYFRNEVETWVGPERAFLDGKLFVSFTLHFLYFFLCDPITGCFPIEPRVEGGYFNDVDPSYDPVGLMLTGTEWARRQRERFRPSGNGLAPGDENYPVDHHAMFLEQSVRLDLRDDPRSPTQGAYFSIGIHEAGWFMPSSWDYLRLTPEARGYVPLPLDMVLAARFGLGIMQIYGTRIDATVSPTLAKLGPESYRLRGGGANSNRGFLPGRLGDGIAGGLRRWEASLELRVPITASFGVVGFMDAGDVAASEQFRFNYPQLSTGFGLRYLTIVGPLRFDIGWQIPGAQYFGDWERRFPRKRDQVDLGFWKFDGAVHLTIGEAF